MERSNLDTKQRRKNLKNNLTKKIMPIETILNKANKANKVVLGSGGTYKNFPGVIPKAKAKKKVKKHKYKGWAWIV